MQDLLTLRIYWHWSNRTRVLIRVYSELGPKRKRGGHSAQSIIRLTNKPYAQRAARSPRDCAAAL